LTRKSPRCVGCEGPPARSVTLDASSYFEARRLEAQVEPSGAGK